MAKMATVEAFEQENRELRSELAKATRSSQRHAVRAAEFQADVDDLIDIGALFLGWAKNGSRAEGAELQRHKAAVRRLLEQRQLTRYKERA
jgi:hypothetical protein